MKEIINDLLTLQGLEWQHGDTVLIAELRLRIPVPILGHYDRLRARQKKGVGGVCAECHMRIPIGVLANLASGADIQLCTCGRYLFLPAALPPSPVPAPPVKPKRKSKKTSSNPTTPSS